MATFLACIPLQACSEDPPPEKAVEWVSKNYEEFPIGGGWKFLGIGTKGSNIEVSVLIPQDQADTLATLSTEHRNRVMGVMCPSRLEPVWDMLESHHDIRIAAFTTSSYTDPFTYARCRLSGR